MIKIRSALVLAFIVPLAAVSMPALAASAHNLQSGAQTSNAYDTAETASLKQMHQDRSSGLFGEEVPAK